MAEGIDPLPLSYNIAPSQAALVVRHQTGAHRVDSLTWGLVPGWMKEPGKIRPINARAETIHQKPMFRDAFRYQRCLVLCDGYYEWKKLTNGRKQPYHLGRPDESPFVMAGLWSHNTHAASEGVETFCVITTRPVVRQPLFITGCRSYSRARSRHNGWNRQPRRPNRSKSCC